MSAVVPAPPEPPPSKRQVDLAGECFREVVHRPHPVTAESLREEARVVEAVDTFNAYRSGVSQASRTVGVALGRMVAAVHPEALDDMTGRPKTLAAVVKKLVRRSTMRLSQMEDIAGFRVKLPTQQHAYGLLERIRERWPDCHVDDYVQQPRDTGYRAIHVVVQEDDHRVEIQLRTEGQNRWADTVEQWGDRLGFNELNNSLKDGQGPADLVEYFRQAAERIAIEEHGGDVDPAGDEAFRALQEQVRPYFQSNPPNGRDAHRGS